MFWFLALTAFLSLQLGAATSGDDFVKSPTPCPSISEQECWNQGGKAWGGGGGTSETTPADVITERAMDCTGTTETETRIRTAMRHVNASAAQVVRAQAPRQLAKVQAERVQAAKAQ
eukprot:CAMPEP_0174353134 /NCGR_PEP_ID=MMETSP0811_2-20130205/13984_1 /TAXON_ID=73025 ORGANISM="Eutreptiella gymnastica-like, Strain CCMP1594" /NCGR_SAMPLE_ID=MMETSP0811_2 /ASSEMBLY_ACC=CAM_ASM_000667 /LENGTH=116 /DNA_ID=CAMNT_0015483531 /DNA_START=23 /DNA_END=371 /DNA_ORIENTATION=-